MTAELPPTETGNAPRGLLGVFLYHSGGVYIDYPSAIVYDKIADKSLARPDTTWRDLLPALTYWHEVDHFCSFVTSPYLDSIGWLVERYASRYTHLWMALRDAGFTDITRPLALDAFEPGRDHPAWDIVKGQLWSGHLIRRALFHNPRKVIPAWDDAFTADERSLAQRLSHLFIQSALGKAVRPVVQSLTDRDARDYTVLNPHLSAMSIVEASAMFHESGNLAMRGIRDERYEQWCRERLVGIYGAIVPHLLSAMDIDIIGVLLKFSLRGSFFPYLGTTERERIGLSEPESADIGSVHPVLVFEKAMTALAKAGMFRASPSARRSQERLDAFYRSVAEYLIEVLAPVQSASAFEAMDDHVFSSFTAWDPEFAASPDNAAYERERRLLAVKRRNIFATEMSDPDYYFRGPVETPPRIVFTDGAFGDPLGNADQGSSYEAIAMGIAVGEALVMNDPALLALLCQTTGRAYSGVRSPRQWVEHILQEFELRFAPATDGVT